MKRSATAMVILVGTVASAFQYPYAEGTRARTVRDLPCPDGFRRATLPEDSFGAYLRHAPLRERGTPVRRHDGVEVAAASEVVAVLDLPLLNQNQQCADSAFRYYFEYLREAGREVEIEARLTNGDWVRLADWKRDRHGQSDDEVFRKFLAHCMAYVGSWSMNRDLTSVDAADLAPGDLIVQPNPEGGIGHLSIVFDVAAGPEGERLFLVGYGYLPAQNVFLARPDTGNGRGAWFTLEGFQRQHDYLGKTYTYRRFGWRSAPRR